ncbi:LysR substrate-binding domain-containing protein [Pseudomonas aeruginosa]|nr:LysR substrate-binding domain-containing protein [Pseudomonas aeruginosa]
MRILADLEEAERCASENAAPRGRLRVNANVPFGHHFLLPLVPEFLAQHPEVTLDIVLTDEVVDILEQRTDVAVRAGPLKSSSLVARKLGSTRMLIVGAPAYLARHGMPATPQALLGHNRLGANYVRTRSGWPLRDAGEELVVPLSGNAQASDGEALRRLAVAGLGLARLAAFQVREDIAAGRLIPVLEAPPGRPGGSPRRLRRPGRLSAAARAGVPELSGGARRYEPGLIAVLHEYADSAAESFSS